MPNERVQSGLVEPQGRGEEPLYYRTRVYLLFLQGLFEDFPEGSYKWSNDEELTEIAITDQAPIPRQVIERRPAIVTMRGPAQFANLTLDQMRKIDTRTGAKERTDIVACTMTVNCIAKLGVEAQRIGWIVMRHLRTFKGMIQKYGNITKVGDEVTIGPESPPGAMVSGEVDPAWSMVTVHSPFFFQWTEVDTPNSVRLRGIELRLQSAMLPLATTDTQAAAEYRAALSPPSIRGRVLATPETGHLRVGNITQKVKT